MIVENAVSVYHLYRVDPFRGREDKIRNFETSNLEVAIEKARAKLAEYRSHRKQVVNPNVPVLPFINIRDANGKLIDTVRK